MNTIILAVVAILGLYLPALRHSGDPPPQDILTLTDEQGEYPLGRYMDILEDPDGELTIEEVASPGYEARFVRSQEDIPNYGYTDTVYWLRLRIRNEAHQVNHWLLETVYPNLNYVDLYIPAEGEDIVKKESGALQPFDTRDIPYHHVVFELPLASQDEQAIYLRVASGSSMTLGFTLWSPVIFSVNKIFDMLLTGLFYGSLLIVMGYHLFLLFSLKEVNYFYFVLFIASSILFFATYEGIADQYLWPGLSQEKLYFIVITMALYFISALMFSDVFLEQKKRSPLFHQIFYIFIGIWGLMIVIVPFSSYLRMAQLTLFGQLLSPVLIALAGAYSWRKGYLPARLFLLSWLGFILGMLTVELVRLDVFPSTALTEKSYQIGLTWLVLLSALALADRIKMLKSQTDEANLQLRKSQNQLTQILEGLPLGVVVYGKDQKPSYINQRTVEILGNPLRGIRPDPSQGRTLAEAIDYFSFRISGSDQPYPLEKLPVTRALQGDTASVDDIEADLVDKHVPLEIWASPIKDDLGNVETAVVAFQDITPRKQVEAELYEFRHHLEQLVEQRTAELDTLNKQLSQEVTVRKSLEEILRKRLEWLSAVNRVHQSIGSTKDLPQAFGVLSTTIIQLLVAQSTTMGLWDSEGNQIEALCHLEGDGLPQPVISSPYPFQKDSPTGKDLEQGKILIFSSERASELPEFITECLHTKDLRSIILAPLISHQKITGVLAVGTQIDLQVLIPEDVDLIERITLDLADLVEDARLFEKAQALAATEERNRLARDLHDSVTQVLFSASLVAEVLPRIWRRDPEMAENSIQELGRLTRGALAEMRTMLLELRPAAVTRTPLGELLAQLTEAITSRSGLPFQLFIEKIPLLPDEVHTSFYRIAQEGLNNVVKHAQANLVTVSLSTSPDPFETDKEQGGEVRMVIKDDGKGFSTQEGYKGRMGMGIIRERAAAINASIDIKSIPGQGTELSLVWHN